MEKTKGGLGRFVAAPHIFWTLLFIIAPLLFVIYYTFTTPDGAFTLDNIFSLKEHVNTFYLSVSLSVIATFICFVLGYPLAYMIAKSGEKSQKIMITLIMLPMWTNLLIRTYSMMAIMDDGGFLNSILAYFNLGKLHLIGTKGAVIFGMVYDFFPYMVLPIYTTISKLDNSVIEAAGDLGCNYFETITKVVLPLSSSGIISGVTMVFVPSISTFYISQKLGGGTFELIGDTIERQFQNSTTYNVGAAISLVMMILVLISLAIMNKFAEKEGGN
ncbi:MAG: ABC transporter permease [Clostridia bacterium]|nr:ABC transporter permease [Oscillospiraceae bacterium]MBR4893125.1 ABC transporter permease [Clostridia bacterium]